MKKLIAGLVLTILMTAAVQAGIELIIGDVAVTDLGGGITEVAGGLVGVRFTKDDVQQIGCGITADSGGAPIVVCNARDINEANYFCFSFDAALIEAVKSISPFSFVRFRFNETAECTSLLVAVRSHHIPDIRTENSVSK
jgi:hypothetical protein